MKFFSSNRIKRKIREYVIVMVCVLSALFVIMCSPVYSNEYDDYNTFCKNEFGAEKEKLVYDMFGTTCQLIEQNIWQHTSLNSAVFGFETNLPALVKIEYGETISYGNTTKNAERYFYNHLHYLNNLKSETDYHYRIVYQDERHNVHYSQDKTFKTRSSDNVILIPGNLGSPPYILDQENSTYVLTQNIITMNRAFTISAKGIILDLNGYTVTYDEGSAKIENTTWNNFIYSSDSTFGVLFTFGGGDSQVLNGIIKQGENNGTGSIGIGFNPIYAMSNSGLLQVAGITVEYAGDSVSGIVARAKNNYIHHNVIKDKGIGIDNRSQGIKAIWIEKGDQVVHNNLVVRARHQGIVTGKDVAEIRSNEVYIDSWATNSFGIKPANLVWDNKIFGTGYHVNGLGWTNGIIVKNNLIHLQGDAPYDRSDEYGPKCSVNGIRLTQYSGKTLPYDNILYHDNTIIVKGRNGTDRIRGVQFFSDPYIKNLVFRNNIVKVMAQDAETDDAYCIVGQGLSERSEEQLPIYYNNNTFISNYGIFQLGDSYGSGGNHQFRDSKIIRIGNDDRFNVIKIGYWNWHSFNNLFIDSIFEGEVNFDKFIFKGSGKRNFSVGSSMYIRAKTISENTINNIPVIVTDSFGRSYQGTTDSTGLAKIELMKYIVNAKVDETETKIVRTDHTIDIEGYASNKIILISNTSVSDPLDIIFQKDNLQYDSNLKPLKVYLIE